MYAGDVSYLSRGGIVYRYSRSDERTLKVSKKENVQTDPTGLEQALWSGVSTVTR